MTITRFLRRCLLLGGVAGAVVFVRLPGSAHPGPVGVTWTSTVARVLDTNCVGCHRQGGASPRLDDYASAKLASLAIKQSVLTRHMPRWYAASGFGDFRNDPTLTQHEIDLLAQWADWDAPHGDPPSVVAARPAPGPPDLILDVPSERRIAETVHTVRLTTGVTEPRWIRGWTFRPGDAGAIAGVVISLGSGTTLATWVPGDGTTFLPADVAARLPAGATVHLAIHYRTPPAPDADVSRVGFYFGERPRRELAHLTLPCGSTRLPHAIDALAIRPAVGSSAWSLAVVARRPAGSIEPLGWFQKYPADHAQTYWFRSPVQLPRGTALEVGATHGGCGAELDYIRPEVRTRAWDGGRTSPPPLHADPRQGRAAASLDEAPEARPPSPEAGAAGYWCPMHTTVRSPERGVCGQCGMGLVPVMPGVEGKYRLDAVLVPGASTPPSWKPRGGDPGASSAGKLRLVVREPVTDTLVRQFETVHERPFHLFVVSDDLQEFSHVHPVAQPDGSFELSPAPLRTAPYQLYADFLPAGGTPQLIRKTVIPRVPPGFTGSRPPHLAPGLGDRTDAGLRVRLDPDAASFVAGTPGTIAFHLEDAATGLPVSDLEPYLGAWGHAFIVSADLVDAVHSHPLTPLTSPGGPTIIFQQRFPRAGAYRIWVQFQRGGTVATVPFTINVVDRPRSN